MSDISNAVKEFFAETKSHYIGLVNDNAWPVIAEQKISQYNISTPNDLITFWKRLRRGFKTREEKLEQHFHKGQIDWQLTQLYLIKGEIRKALKSLDDAAQEDEIRSPGAFLAAHYFRSVIKPLIFRFEKRQQRQVLNKSSLKYFNSLSSNESSDLKRILFEVHDFGARGEAMIINDFSFITNTDLRPFVEKTYKEVSLIIFRLSAETYYSSIITIGGILEAMLGDLIVNSSKISNRKKKKIKGAGLGTMIGILRGNRDEIIPKHILMLCEMICEYRNMIHSSHAVSNEHNLGRYLASYQLSLLAYIGHYCWPSNT